MTLYEKYISSITVAKNKILVCTKIETSQNTVRRIIEDKYHSTIGRLIFAEDKKFIFQVSDTIEKKKVENKTKPPEKKISTESKTSSSRTRKPRSRTKTTKSTNNT